MRLTLMMKVIILLLLADCHRGCANGGQCIEPEVCQCVEPFVGVTCRENREGTCINKL